MLDNKKLWEDAVTEIELSISRATFLTWFKNTYIHKQDDNVVFLSVPSTFVKEWLLNKYHKIILKALRNISPNIRALEYAIHREGDKVKEQTGQAILMNKPISENQLKLNEIFINKEDNLNPKYIFENFVVGPFNELAHAATQAVIKNPGTSYNPLFIYGGTGLGKTHLLQAVGNTLKAAGKKVFYLTSERFGTELFAAMSNATINQVKEKYRRYDLLIMDDVQFFGGKDKFQEELFHLFNDLHSNNKQIIFSSDKPPKHISGLADRLRSRFEGGMTVDISKPDYESKLLIIKHKTRMASFSLTDEVQDFIATIASDNIRELEGMINNVILQSQMKKRDLNVNEVKCLIKTSQKQKKVVSVKDIIKAVSDFYGIEERFLYEKTRRKEVVKPRQIAMYILRNDFNASFPYIGQKFGGRDHTTVIHACDKIKEDAKQSENLTQEIEQIKNIIFSIQTSGVAGDMI